MLNIHDESNRNEQNCVQKNSWRNCFGMRSESDFKKMRRISEAATSGFMGGGAVIFDIGLNGCYTLQEPI